MFYHLINLIDYLYSQIVFKFASLIIEWIIRRDMLFEFY